MTPNPTCQTCRFYLSGAGLTHDGECHRNPPISLDPSRRWPTVLLKDWCGAHDPEPVNPDVQTNVWHQPVDRIPSSIAPGALQCPA